MEGPLDAQGLSYGLSNSKPVTNNKQNMLSADAVLRRANTATAPACAPAPLEHAVLGAAAQHALHEGYRSQPSRAC